MKKIAITIAAAFALFAALCAPAKAAQTPYMDVPASHWAYDAVDQLTAVGVLSGFEDGKFLGSRSATRYEFASALARCLAVSDITKASKEDLALLRRLVFEFRDELDALGVKIDGIERRVAVLEKDLGGWRLSGELRFDAKFARDAGFYSDTYTMDGKDQFDIDRYRIYISKRINETTTFFARLGASGSPRAGNGRAAVVWEEYYIRTELGRNITMTAGVFEVDWERELGMYIDDDAWFGDQALSAFMFQKDLGSAFVRLLVGRWNDSTGLPEGSGYDQNCVRDGTCPMTFEKFLIAGLANYDINEHIRIGAMIYSFISDSDEKTFTAGAAPQQQDTDWTTYGGYLAWQIVPAVEIKGIYYHQNQAAFWRNWGVFRTGMQPDDDADMWRVMLDVKQDALRFSSLWVEYGQMDNNFIRWGDQYSKEGGRLGPFGDMGEDILGSHPWNNGTSKILGVRADQKWSSVWRTFARYWQVDYDTVNVEDAKQWGIGVAYRVNPALEFELAYDHVDYGRSAAIEIDPQSTLRSDNDHLVRLRTFVSF